MNSFESGVFEKMKLDPLFDKNVIKKIVIPYYYDLQREYWTGIQKNRKDLQQDFKSELRLVFLRYFVRRKSFNMNYSIIVKDGVESRQ